MIVYWDFFFWGGVDLTINIYIDWMSLLFSGVVFFITFFVIIYSLDYLGKRSKYINIYFYLVLLFVLSIGLVIYSPNLFSILLG